MDSKTRLGEASAGLAGPHPRAGTSFGGPTQLPDDLIGESAGLRDALSRVERVAPTDTTVLVTGETGTGKERIARALHKCSRRAGDPLVAVNLAAIPETLVASELFGHEHGAFTGAVQRRIGRFEAADRGTLFLDEVGELSPDIQVSLLRIVQDGEFERLGSSQTRRTNVRLVTATNRSLERSVDEGRFRPDLYYRLSVFPIHLPSLRERPEDIPALALHFLQHVARRLGRAFSGIDGASLERLVAFRWPGNIRQLQNIIEHSAVLSDDPVLRIPAALLATNERAQRTSNLDGRLQETERQLIDEALTAAEGRVSGELGAAVRLGIPASTLESKIRRLHIDKLNYRLPQL